MAQNRALIAIGDMTPPGSGIDVDEAQDGIGLQDGALIEQNGVGNAHAARTGIEGKSLAEGRIENERLLLRSEASLRHEAAQREEDEE